VKLPLSFLNSLEGLPGFDRTAFEAVHDAAVGITSVRVNPAKLEIPVFPNFQPVSWSRYGWYLQSRPSFTFDPLFHAGCYYVQEASSMFLEQALKQCADVSKKLRVLDLCASPGGKSTHLQSLLSTDSLLVSNEVIRNRAAVLKQNIIKWGTANVVVTNNDPVHFGRLEGFFDVMVIDAPCSGSGLFRRDETAIQEWSQDNVQLCYGRQQRILSDAMPALKEGGILIYSTCSYSRLEDEQIMDWLVEEWGMGSLSLQLQEDWNIVTSETPLATGYRFYPNQVKGEGFFLACFRKMAGGSAVKYKTSRPEKATAKEKEILSKWVQLEGMEVFKTASLTWALPDSLAQDLSVLQANLFLQYAGITIGEIMHNKLVPDHALALSLIVQPYLPITELTYEEAIKYLQRADLHLTPAVKGWQRVTFQNQVLGWMNALPNRINNYYPKEMRILKQHNDSAFEK
jgi:16S rRNA C967 or C1407 C5-methylase (RsmB/RsmF family)/NOL1/NOP2/fmu family ribosome biogenesis protein